MLITRNLLFISRILHIIHKLVYKHTSPFNSTTRTYTIYTPDWTKSPNRLTEYLLYYLPATYRGILATWQLIL